MIHLTLLITRSRLVDHIGFPTNNWISMIFLCYILWIIWKSLDTDEYKHSLALRLPGHFKSYSNNWVNQRSILDLIISLHIANNPTCLSELFMIAKFLHSKRSSWAEDMLLLHLIDEVDLISLFKTYFYYPSHFTEIFDAKIYQWEEESKLKFRWIWGHGTSKYIPMACD